MTIDGFKLRPTPPAKGRRVPLRLQSAAHNAVIGVVALLVTVGASMVLGNPIAGGVLGVLGGALAGALLKEPAAAAAQAETAAVRAELEELRKPESGSARFRRLEEDQATINRMKKYGGLRDR